MTHTDLQQKLETQSARLAVVGLGYVGLPVACLFAQAGFKTIGVDLLPERVEMLQRGENPIQGIEPGLSDLIADVIGSGRLSVTTDISAIAEADVILVAVQTPVDDSDHRPRYQYLRPALEGIGRSMKPGALVIMESTLAPKTMHTLVIPVLQEASGRTVGQDFYVGHCPERVMPGVLLHNIRTMSRVVGGDSPATAETMTHLYRWIVQGSLDTTDLLTAEIVKTTENAYRDVQIAFANEVARVCEDLGGDVWKVRELVNKSPSRQMHLPGAGVGGHCIPKDSWLLLANTSIETSLIPSARAVNRAMPQHVADLVSEALAKCGKSLNGAVLAVLGYAYRENSDDTRDTPSQAFVEIAESAGALVRIHDPFVAPYQQPLESITTGTDAIVILVAHNEYKQTDWTQHLTQARTPILIDTRRVLPVDFEASNAVVRILGQGTHHA